LGLLDGLARDRLEDVEYRRVLSQLQELHSWLCLFEHHRSKRRKVMITPHKPAGLLKWAYKLPSLLYHWQLGWVLGDRFLMVAHLGRKTGRIRQTVLEVVDYNPETREYVVAAVYGRQSDWYQNIHTRPALWVQVGRERYAPLQRDPSPEETLHLLRAYQQQKHSWAFRQFLRMLYGYDGTESALEELSQKIPTVAFRPHTTE
jgi:deazaflavin-dependent oxidoreductase (nitroreductase family)